MNTFISFLIITGCFLFLASIVSLMFYEDYRDSLRWNELHECTRCETLFYTRCPGEFLCPSCRRAIEILESDREFMEPDRPSPSERIQRELIRTDAAKYRWN